MKLKYKKIILLTTMSTMGIGLLTLSLTHDKSEAMENLNPKVSMNSVYAKETGVVDNNDTNAQVEATITNEPLVTVVPTEVPTPTPLPVYEIEKEGYPKINKLIEDFYTAKNNRDIEALKALMTDPSQTDSQEDLQKKTEYIDDYRNVKVYVKKGYQEGTYIVYAYSEIKFTSINTPAPGLAKFYVITTDDKSLKIFSGDMDKETQAYYDQRDTDKDVVKLIDMTDKKGDEAIKSDEDLLNFWNNMDAASGDTAAKDAKTDKKKTE